MLLNLRQYHRPTGLADAVALVRKDPDTVAPLAGGTYLVASGAPEITEVVDLTDLGLNFINQGNSALHIGATMTLQEIIDSEVVKGLAQGLLVQSCRATTVSRMRRNASTIGGEVVRAALPSAVPVALLALDTRLKVVDENEREVPLAHFYQGPGQEQFRGAIITEVVIPTPRSGTRAAFLRLAQLPSSIPIIQIATLVEIEDDICQLGRIAIGAVTAKPVRLSSVEERLKGRRLDEQVISMVADEVAASLDPISDTRGSADYRRQMSRVLTRRALGLLAGRN